ncbi:alpha/beta hydrolase [Streptomyces sp. ISL-90]|nr:alpha/beta hydrolase [Streptomyces sp. ISL-90]
MTVERADDAAAAATRLRMSDVHPELQRAYRRLPRTGIRHGWQRRLVRAAMRFMPEATLSDGQSLERIDFETRGTGVRVVTPAGGGSGGALLWIHGGGLVIGAATMDDRLCAQLAARLGIVVVSVEYRLAPEHPFPAPLDDCAAAWQWLRDAASARGVDPHRIAVGGQSAGGGLAAALVQRVHDAGGPQPIAQLLYCPMLDDRTAARRDLDAVRHFAWNNRDNLVGWSSYLGGPPGAARGPDHAVPARRADVSGLPAAWIGVGDIDLFHDEDLAYAAALRDAGVECTVDVVPGAPHGFESIGWDAELVRAFHARAQAWLGERLTATRGV